MDGLRIERVDTFDQLKRPQRVGPVQSRPATGWKSIRPVVEFKTHSFAVSSPFLLILESVVMM